VCGRFKEICEFFAFSVYQFQWQKLQGTAFKIMLSHIPDNSKHSGRHFLSISYGAAIIATFCLFWWLESVLHSWEQAALSRG